MRCNKLSLAIVASMSLLINAGCSSNTSMIVDYGAEGAASIQHIDHKEGKQALADAAPCCRSLAELNYQPVTEPGKLDYTIGLSSDVFNFKTGKSFVQGIKLPEADGEIKISLSSPVIENVFVPSVLILDEDFNPLRLYGKKTITYEEATILSGERYFGEFRLKKDDRARYLVVFTTEEAMSGETELAELSVDAVESGGVRAANRFYKNEPVPHAAIGVVRVAYDYLPETLSRSMEVISADVVTAAPQTETEAVTLVIEEPRLAEPDKAVQEKVIQPETEAMFIELIQKAIKEGDLNKAMRIVEDAERAGSTKAREVLIRSLK